MSTTSVKATRGHVSLALVCGDYRTVPATLVCGLAVHGERWNWRVTHIGSGMRFPGRFSSRSRAVGYAKALAPLMDWEEVRDAQDVPDDVKRAACDLRDRYA